MNHQKLVLRTDQPDKEGNCFLRLRITESRTRKVTWKTLGIKFNPKHWNAEKEQVRRTHAEHESLNRLIAAKKHDLVRIHEDGFDLDEEYDRLDAMLSGRKPEEVKVQREVSKRAAENLKEQQESERQAEMLKKTLADSNTYLYSFAMKEFEKHRRLSFNTWTIYSRGVGDFVKFAGNLRLHEVTPRHIKEWIAEMESEGKLPNTIISKTKSLRAAFKAAKEADLIEQNPFEIKRIARPKPIERDVEVFKYQELWDMDKWVMSLNKPRTIPSKIHYWNMFVFACGTGLRFSDVILLTWGRIKGEQVDVRTQKTKTKKVFGMAPLALKVLERYQRKKDEDFVFPFLQGEPIGTSELLSLATGRNCTHANICIRNFRNEFPGKICRLHFHLSRIFYATEFLRRGGNVVMLQKILGHKSLTQTQQYLRLVDTDVNEEILKVWGN